MKSHQYYKRQWRYNALSRLTMICIAMACTAWATASFLYGCMPWCIGAGIGSLFFSFVAAIKHRDAEESWQRYFRSIRSGMDWE
jgi:hypothetical protein